jgi:hypothetical protein
VSDFIDVLLNETDEEGDGKKPTHRLFGIRPGEISFVDRGANKKKWAVIKREHNMTTETKTSPEDQAVVAAVVKDGEEVPAGGGLPETGAPPAAEGEAPAAMKIPGPVKQEILTTMTAALESLVDLANRVKNAQRHRQSWPRGEPGAAGGRARCGGSGEGRCTGCGSSGPRGC